MKKKGIGKSSQDSVVEKARTFGISHGEASGRLKKFMDFQFFNYFNSEMFAYQRKLFAFKGEKLTAVLELPKNLWSIFDKQFKRKSERLMKNEKEVSGIPSVGNGESEKSE